MKTYKLRSILQPKEEPENSQSNRAGAMQLRAGGQTRLSRPVRATLLILVLFLPVTLISCGGSNPVSTTTPAPPVDPLLKVSQAIDTIQQTDKQLTASIIQANAAKLLSDSTTDTILKIALKISQGGDQAAAVVQNLSTLPAGTKLTLWNVLKPVSQAVNDSLASVLIPIADQNTKTSIQALLTTIQGALAIVQVQTGN